MNWDLVRSGVARILAGLDCDSNDPNFAGTPSRVVDVYKEIFDGLDNVPRKIGKILDSAFPCDHDQLVIARGLDVYGVCPHHLLPVHYSMVVGYLPASAPEGLVVGLSKLYRLVKLLASRPVLQERMVNDIAAAVMQIPGCQGSGVVAHGEHLCIRMRGVQQVNSIVTTSSLRGVFLTDGDVRSEFMALCRSGG
jgi:GTP cyclohydrolase I